MKTIGIVARAYKNIDSNSILQVSEQVRRVLTKYDDVVSICILPTEDIVYESTNLGEDSINKEKLDHVLNMCDGFILPGGTNYYNFDMYVLEHAIKYDKPLLGICLGFQTICAYNAHTRTSFDMNTEIGNNNHVFDHDKYKHKNNIVDNTILKSIINESIIPVNSYHIHKVEYDMDNVVINAISEDNIIEGVEYPNKKFIIGVQWHPEYLGDIYSNRLFDKFINCIKGE